MMFVWVEWICKKCDQLHRGKFDVIPNRNKDIKIVDIAHNREHRINKAAGGGSQVYVPYETEVPKLLEKLTAYMLNTYSIKENTLTLEVCTA